MEVGGRMALVPVEDPDAGLVLVARVDDRERLVRGHEHAEKRALLWPIQALGTEAVRIEKRDRARVVAEGAVPREPLRIPGERDPVTVERADERVLVKVDVSPGRRILTAAIDVELESDRPARVKVRGIELDARGKEALPELGVRQIELPVILPGPGREQAVLRVIAV